MGTVIALLLVLSALTACASPAPVDLETVPAFSETALAAAAAPETFHYRVELVEYVDAVSDEDGTPLASCRFQIPTMTVCRADGSPILQAETDAETAALAKAETFNGQFASWAAAEDFAETASWAAEDLAWQREAQIEGFIPYEEELSCTVYQTERLISVRASYYSYTGGAHPNTYLAGWNFDLEDGVFFTPEVLARDGQAFSEAVQEEIIRQSLLTAAENGMAPEDFFWQDYQTGVENWSSCAVSFDEEGMTVGFSPYELAAYAAGPQVFHLSYDWLEPYLSGRGAEVLGLAAE